MDFSVQIANSADIGTGCTVSRCEPAGAVPSLWPGDDRIDWVFFNIFEKGKKHGTVKADYASMIHASMSALNVTTADKHCHCVPSRDTNCNGCNLGSKPWGLGAFGTKTLGDDGKPAVTPADEIRFLADASSMIKALQPHIKAYLYFDSQDSQIALNGSGTQPEVKAAFQSFLATPEFAVNDAGAPHQ